MNHHLSRRTWVATVLLALLIYPLPVSPATIEVNDTCKLVDAMEAANSDTAVGGCPAGDGPDTLVLTADVTLTVIDNYGESGLRRNGLPEVSTDITVEGGDFAIERDPDAPGFRIFSVLDTGTLRLNDVTVRGGSTGGGGILANGDVFLTGSTVTGNSGGGIRVGGGSHLTMTHSEVTDNVDDFRGAGVNVFRSFLTMTASTVSGNRVIPTAAADLPAPLGGGGVYIQISAATITNSTISGNAGAELGGGILMGYNSNLTLSNTTISGNTAETGAGIRSDYGYPIYMSNSIVANNGPGGNCSYFDSGGLGNNFDDDGSCPGAAPIVPGVDFDTTLADNGGPTPTHALTRDSVARDAAGDCGLETDQRGAPRDDGACDAGSFEVQPLQTGACCIAPDSQRVCMDNLTRDDCEARGGIFAGPGTDCGDPLTCELLLVTIDSMAAIANGLGVDVTWTTSVEVDTVGFRVLRESGRREKSLQLVSIVAAAGSPFEGHAYTLLDDAPEAGRARRYFIEDVDIFGRVTRHGPIVVDRGVRQGPAGNAGDGWRRVLGGKAPVEVRGKAR